MKKQEFSEEFLKSIRDTLPQGAQTKIAQKLSTPESPLNIQDVNKVLHGKGLKYEKCSPSVIIWEAVTICSPIWISQEEVKRAMEANLNDSKK